MKLMFTGPVAMGFRLDENGEQVWQAHLEPDAEVDLAPVYARRLVARGDFVAMEGWPAGESPDEIAAAAKTAESAAAAVTATPEGQTPPPDAPPAPSVAPPAPALSVTAPAPVYLFVGADEHQIDAAVWPLAPVETAEAEPRPLYHFTHDQPGGAATGASPEWVPFTGPTQAAPPTSN